MWKRRDRKNVRNGPAFGTTRSAPLLVFLVHCICAVHCLYHKLSPVTRFHVADAWIRTTMSLKPVFFLFFAICRVSAKNGLRSLVSSAENSTRSGAIIFITTTIGPNTAESYGHIWTMGGLIVFIVIVTVSFILCRNGPPYKKKRIKRSEMALSLATTRAAYIGIVLLE